MRWIIPIALVLVAAGVFAMIRLTPRDRSGDPAAVPLPDVTEQSATETYLGGPGRPLLVVIAATEALVRGAADQAACRQLVSTTLPPLGEPPALVDLAAGIPDPDTAEMFSNDLDATMGALSACVDGAKGIAPDLAFSRTIVTRRLAQLQIG